MQEIILRHIDNKINEIKEKYTIIKEINFNTDINNTKSIDCFYTINSENHELTFLYGNKKCLFDYPLNNIFTDEVFSDKIKSQIPLKVNGNNYLMCSYSSAYQLQDDDILHFRYTKNEILNLVKNIYNFYISLSDETFYKSYTNFIKTSYTNNNFADLSSDAYKKGLLNSFNISANNNSILMGSVINNYATEATSIFNKKLSLKNNNDYVLSRIDNSIFFNNTFSTIQTSSPLTSLKNLSINAWSTASNTIELNKDNFIIGSKTGSIYLNDIVIPNDVKKIKIFLLSKGHTDLEVLSKEQWININSLELENINILKLRLSMEYGAKIKNLIIIKAN